MLLVAGIAVAAIVHVAQNGGEDAAVAVTTGADTSAAETTPVEPTELPAILPLSGELRQEGGVLWWSDERCRAMALDLSSGRVASLPGEHCRIWPAPDGSRVVATATNRSDALEGRGLVQFSYPPPDGARALGDEVVVTHDPGVIASELAWLPSGRSVLACVATQRGTVVMAAGPEPHTGVGTDRDACFPAVLEDGRYAVVHGAASLELEGRPLLTDADLERLLPNVPRRARRAVSALGPGDGEVVAGLVVVSRNRLLPHSAALAVVGADGVRFSAFLPEGVLPAAVGLSPRGNAVWFFDAGAGTAGIKAIPGGRQQPPFGARWLAWSPSGDYLAAASEGSIQILTWPDAVEVERIPAAANIVAWTAAPGG